MNTSTVFPTSYNMAWGSSKKKSTNFIVDNALGVLILVFSEYLSPGCSDENKEMKQLKQENEKGQ